MRCISVLIADRHPVFSCGLMSVLGAENDFRIVASCCDGTHCIEAIRSLSPALALIDISMPGLPGLEIPAATSEPLCTRVIFLAASVGVRELAIAAAWGAFGIVTKEAAPELLVRCLRQVAAGCKLLPPSFLNGEARQRQACSARAQTTEDVLKAPTKRERQIMPLVSEGLSNKEIGRRLDLSDGTIKVHLHNIYQKLAINNRTTLAALVVSS